MSDISRSIDLEEDIPELDVELEHTEHVVVGDAMEEPCVEGECSCDCDASGDPMCPTLTVVVCVDCMYEDGAGRDPSGWEARPLFPWPHPESVISGRGE